MIPTTPRGFRDTLPTQMAWRDAVARAVCESFGRWGYVPVQTPTLERCEVLELAGKLSDPSFKFFDSDGKLLCLRPDCTLPVARMTALRLRDRPAPFRFYYSEPVFREQGSLYGEDREFVQMGIECMGASGVAADAEVLCLMFDALNAAGIENFTVALGTVGVLNALVAGASSDQEWRAAILGAFHGNDYVAVQHLVRQEGVIPAYADAIAQITRIRGGIDAIERCRALVKPLGCEADLDHLQAVFDLVCATERSGQLMVDFSIVSSFDYYTGMVFKAYAPQLGQSLAGGGRYDTTLEAFGRKEPAAGFALGLERVMKALELQGAQAPSIEPDEVVEPQDGEDLSAVFERAAQLRAQGKRVVIGGTRL